VSRYPDDCLGYRARAEAFWYEDRLSDAIRDYSRAIELNAADILSRSGRGQVLAELGRSTGDGLAQNDSATVSAGISTVGCRLRSIKRPRGLAGAVPYPLS
jgi:hypothetical protein